MEWDELLKLLQQGRLTVYPLLVLSVIVMGIGIERLLRYRGLEKGTRELTRKVVDLLVRRDVAGARSLCENAKTPMGDVFSEGLRWRNIALEDLNEVLSTAKNETVTELRSRLWFIGTVGSLAPYIGLLGTVVGIMGAFGAIAESGDAGFAVVSEGISEALIATAVGLLVAILALAFFNFLQIRVNAIATTFSRASERFVQALLFLEAGQDDSAASGKEESHGDLSPARG